MTATLPYLANWLRLDAPRRILPRRRPPTRKSGSNSASCQNCHQQAFQDWSESNHRLMGNSHPYYKVVQALARETEGEAFGQWCQGCHMPQQVMNGQTDLAQGLLHVRAGRSLAHCRPPERREPVVEEGTGCVLCHRITKLEDAGGNSAFTVNLKDRESYVFEDALAAALQHWLAERQINARPAMHKASYQKGFLPGRGPGRVVPQRVCPGTGANIVNTWDEWESSSFAKAEDPAKRRTCIDCHMNPAAWQRRRAGGRPVHRKRHRERAALSPQLYRRPASAGGAEKCNLEQESLALLRSSATLRPALKTRVANPRWW